MYVLSIMTKTMAINTAAASVMPTLLRETRRYNPAPLQLNNHDTLPKERKAWQSVKTSIKAVTNPIQRGSHLRLRREILLRQREIQIQRLLPMPVITNIHYGTDTEYNRFFLNEYQNEYNSTEIVNQ
jgi:hypothetical protein